MARSRSAVPGHRQYQCHTAELEARLGGDRAVHNDSSPTPQAVTRSLRNLVAVQPSPAGMGFYAGPASNGRERDNRAGRMRREIRAEIRRAGGLTAWRRQ